MTMRIRPGGQADLDALYQLACQTGTGLTNLPPDRDVLAAKLIRSEAAFARADLPPDDELYVFLAEDTDTGHVCGTAQIFSRIGMRWPFYNYKLTAISQSSKELGRTFRAEMLNLVTDFDGATEVGGLFLLPQARTGGIGGLLARSRYLFIAMHRRRFGATVMAELRGVGDDAGNAPFWEGLGQKFFGMTFQEADRFNALHGNQFIADLMPKHPIYTALLAERARAAIGQQGTGGTAARAMLEEEGFRYDGYIDIFDGGPALAAPTAQLRTVRDARNARVSGALGNGDEGAPAIVASGGASMFNATFANIAAEGDSVTMSKSALATLGLKPGDEITYVFR